MSKQFVRPHVGSFSGLKYWIVLWSDGEFGWQYMGRRDRFGEAQAYGRDGFESIGETLKDIERRESFIANGESVMV